MAKKLDSEALKKNGFWIALGAFVLLWLIAAVVILWPADLPTKKEYEDTKKAAEGAQSIRPKTLAYQKPWLAHAEKFKAEKDKVWGSAWDQQSLMYDWPVTMVFKPQYP